MTAIKVGTLVMVLNGPAKGKTGVVTGHDLLEFSDHRVRFPSPVNGYRCGRPSVGAEGWAPRCILLPLTPPDEPDTMIESTPISDEVTA